MAIVNAEIRASRPFLRVDVSSLLGWQQIGYYGDPVLVVRPD